MKWRRGPKRVCLKCGSGNDAHQGFETKDEPEPGDLSICWYCGHMAIFTKRGLREPNEEEAERIAHSPKVRAALGFMRRN